jgi:hypothetical protein
VLQGDYYIKQDSDAAIEKQETRNKKQVRRGKNESFKVK